MPKDAEIRLFRPKYVISAKIAVSAERSKFAEMFWHLSKPKISAEKPKESPFGRPLLLSQVKLDLIRAHLKTQDFFDSFSSK